ncbi:MAG: alpha/beta hydrolase [bacterium]|nr:alpha/beta hydrolase [bacterium]
MKKVVLLYGLFAKEIATLPECNPNDERNWMGWIKKQLTELGYYVVCPIIPKVWEAPLYSEWKKVLDEAVIDENTVLVGLSAGGAVCVKYITEEKKVISKLILIAPSYWSKREDGFPITDDFVNFKIADDTKKQIKNGTIIFVSDDDPLAGTQEAVKIYERELDATVVRFVDRGHFSFHIRTFQELLEEILKPHEE